MRRVNVYEHPRLWDTISAEFGGEEFFLTAACETGGPVLELGSGTGRIISVLTGSGIDCVGLDLSPEMTRYASEMYPNVQFVTGDMRNFELRRRFKLVLVANNTIQYLHENQDFLSAMEAMRRHLLPGGKVLLSMINPRPERIKPIPVPVEAMRFEDPDTGREIVIMQTFEYNPDTRIGTTIWINHDCGRPILEYDFPLVFRTADEVSNLCEAAGLMVVSLFGDHEGAPYSPQTSPSMVFSLSAD